MVHILEEKWMNFFLLTYLIFVLICSTAISAGEAFYLEYSKHDNLSSDGYLSSISRNIDWLAGITIRKAKNNSNSLLRNRLIRMFTLSGPVAIAIYLVGASLKVKNDNTSIIKNLVLLKLRI